MQHLLFIRFRVLSAFRKAFSLQLPFSVCLGCEVEEKNSKGTY